MKLDDLKSAWSEYDVKLSKSLKINEELLRKMNLDKSKQEMKTPIYYEIAGLFINFLTFVYILSVSIKYMDVLKFSGPGIICSIILGLYTVFSVLKVGKMSNVNYLNEPVIELQNKLSSIKSMVLKFRRWEIYLITPLVITILPILFFDLYNINVYQETHWFIFEMIAILVIVFPLTIWLNKTIYDKRMKNTEDFLKDISAFKKE